MVARFKLDENLPRDAEALLRGAGHDVRTVLGQRLGGSPDAEVFDVCRREDRILVTLDLDFADIRFYPPADLAGIWLLRPAAHGIEATLALLRSALTILDTEQVERRLWIIEPGRVRIRN